MKKKIFAIALMGCFVFGVSGAYANVQDTPVIISADEKDGVYVNGEVAGTFIKKGDKLLVPVRTIAEGLGYTVEWKGESKTIVLTKGAQYVTMSVGVDGYTVAKTAPMPLGAAPEVVDGKTYVPYELFADLMEISATVNEDKVEFVNVEETKGVGVVKSTEGEIFFEDEEIGEVVLNLGDEVEITYADGSKAKAEDITEGCRLQVVYGDAMTMSLPPINNPKSIVIESKPVDDVQPVENLSIKGTVKEIVDNMVVVESDDKDSSYPEVALRVTENTKADEVKAGDMVEAEFSPIMTRSLPPQSEAFSIKVVK